MVADLDQRSKNLSPMRMKRLLPRPLSGHFKPVQLQYPPTRLSLRHALPWEIFIEIAGFLNSEQLLNFSLTVNTYSFFLSLAGINSTRQSSQYRRLLLPELYRTVALESSRACLSGLTMLRKHPELCGYIRTLIVRPNYALACWPRTDGPISEMKVASIIRRLAGRLKNLKKFVWGGNEHPPEELWDTLRRMCVDCQYFLTARSLIPVGLGVLCSPRLRLLRRGQDISIL